MNTAITRSADERVRWMRSFPFVLLQFSPLLIFVTGISWTSAALCVGMYLSRMWFITAGYHRYFAHRAYRTNRVFQFVLAFVAAPRRRRAPCGGRPTIASIIERPSRKVIHTRRSRASGTPTSAGS